MTDISAIVEYDKTYPVALLNPNTAEPVGITFNVVSFDADRVVKAIRKLEADRWAEEANGADVDFADYISRQERVRLIAAIDSWDFGGKSWGALGVNPECNEDNKAAVINSPNAKWVRDQLALKGANIANFMQALQPGVKNTSPKT